MQTKYSYKHGYMRERKRCGPRKNLGFYALRSKNFGLEESKRIRQGEPGSILEIRVGHDKRKALGTPMGIRR